MNNIQIANNLVRIAKSLISGDIADKGGIYKNFTGEIDYGKNKGKVRNATFELKYNKIIWKSGDWENGTWYNGIWYGGDWKDGTWHDGKWYDGTWKNGTWYKGTWGDGVWYNGTWKNGTWINGKIYNKKSKKLEDSIDNPNKFLQ